MLRFKLEQLGSKESAGRVERIRDEFLAEQRRRAPYVRDDLWALIRDGAADGASP
jgi:hypothetical protein